MKTWSDRAIKICLSSARCPLGHARNSARTAHSFLERWARQLAYYWGSGTAQQSLVQYGLEKESQRCKSIESINRAFLNILSLLGSLLQVLASTDTEIAPRVSQYRKSSERLFSMKTWSNRVKKTALGSVRRALEYIRISDESAYSFLKRWARQLAYYWGSGTGQKPFVQYGLETESQCSKSIESINRPFLDILSLPGSLLQVLASTDTEMAPARLPISKTLGTPFLYEDMVRSGQKKVVGQRSVCSRIYQNFRRIGTLLPGTVGMPTCLLSGKRDGTEIHSAVPIMDGISAFHFYRIHQ